MSPGVESEVLQSDSDPVPIDSGDAPASCQPSREDDTPSSPQPSTSSLWVSGVSRSEKKICGMSSASTSVLTASGDAFFEEAVRAGPDIPNGNAPVRQDQRWCVSSIAALNSAMTALNCSVCQNTDCLEFVPVNEKRKGMALFLQLQCKSCSSLFSEGYTSPWIDGTDNVHAPFMVNDLFVLFLREIGLGHTALKKFCTVFGMQTLNKNVYQRKQSRVCQTIIETTHDLLEESVQTVWEAHREVDPNFDGDICVSFDGTWHKRGHTSHYGVGAVIDVLTGLVVDYEVLSTYCQACAWNAKTLGEGSVAYQDWYEGHEED